VVITAHWTTGIFECGCIRAAVKSTSKAVP